MKRKEFPMEELLKIKAENKQKLDELLAIPNYQEVLGRKHYGDRWRVTLYDNHPDREDWSKLIQMNAYRRQNGEEVPHVLSLNRRPINQIDIEGNFIQEWKSSIHYCEAMGMETHSAQQLTSCARGDAKTAYGYKWEFADAYMG